MREILFRAKHYKTKQWVYGIPFRNPVNGLDNDAYYPQIIPEINKMHSTIDRCSVIEETISQYTGLTDKKGTKIFEGDIVEYQGKRYSINYLLHYARFSAVKPNTVFCVFAYQHGEVIGNIYDNPELLKDGESE